MRTISFLALSLLLAQTTMAQKDGQNMFAPEVLHEIRFESENPDFFSLLVSTWASNWGNVPYLMANVRVDGQLIDSVGVRIKGGISASNQKRPLKIDFNRFVAGKNYDGLKMLNLQNADYDHPLQRDMLGYVVFRQAGVKSSRSSYAKVFVNDVYHGVYVLVEQVDKTFLNNQFANDGGILYKNKTGSVEVDSGEDTLEYYQEMNQIANQPAGNAFATALEEVLDTDAFLRFFLVEHYINAADNPIDVNANYYIYRIPGIDKLYWIPWDLNYAFYTGKDYDLYQTGINNIFKRMLETPVYREQYTRLACEMMQYLFTEERLHPFIDQNAELIRDAVAIDPRYDYTMADFDNGVELLKTYVTEKRQKFLEDLSTNGVVCPELAPPVFGNGIVINEFVASANSAGGIADPQGQYPDWIELHNTTDYAVPLDQYYLSNHPHNLKHWRFPEGTEIASNDYLVVWADRDIADEGLHADFKLNKDEGRIYLSFENLEIMDSVTYVNQITNVASARIPNGVGDFVSQAPTFATNNEPASGIITPWPNQTTGVFPNPASEVLEFIVTGQPATYYCFRLTNQLGQTVLLQYSNKPSATMDVSHLPPGQYFASIVCDRNQYQHRIVLAR